MADKTYTLAQAAAELGVREDDLDALLPTAEIDLMGRIAPALTQAEVDKLSQLMQNVHAIHREGPTGGIEEG